MKFLLYLCPGNPALLKSCFFHSSTAVRMVAENERGFFTSFTQICLAAMSMSGFFCSNKSMGLACTTLTISTKKQREVSYSRCIVEFFGLRCDPGAGCFDFFYNFNEFCHMVLDD